MIQGSFSLNSSLNCKSVDKQYVLTTEATFNSVVQGSFSGGYYLHPRLPNNASDKYFLDKSNDILVLLSGCVYNRSELYEFCQIEEPVTDPELVATMFIKEGPDFVKRLNGDFAIFIGLPKIREAYLFRDHAGIRPLAWSVDEDTLIFSTDILKLCHELSDSKVIDTEYLLAYFKFVDYRLTPDNKVKKLLPAHFLHFSENGIKLTRYWEPEKIQTDNELTYEKMISDLGYLAGDAVRIRCDRRFTAGAHVSSGLDSGIVSALARTEFKHQDNFYGFSWSPEDYSPEDVKYDERELVVKACKNSLITPLFSDTKATEFQQIVSNVTDNYGIFPEYKTVEQAVTYKTNIIFSGWGGDEFISTGNRGIDQDLLSRFKLKRYFRRNSVRNPKAFVSKLFTYVIFPALGIMDSETAKSFRDDSRYIRKQFKQSNKKSIRNFYFHTSRHQMHLRLMQFYHLQARCESWAINGFRRGVEYRYPLLDRRILEYMLKVPSDVLCKSDLYRPVLREISEGILCSEVRWNKYKTDPVYFAWMEELFKNSALVFMKELDDWKENQDLQFIDFKLLAEDISKFRKKPEDVDQKILFRALVYIKLVNEFVKKYKQSMKSE